MKILNAIKDWFGGVKNLRSIRAASFTKSKTIVDLRKKLEAMNDWRSVKDKLPGDDTLCLIRHYNGYKELAYRRDGNWYVQSDSFSKNDKLLGVEGQPDFWQKISEPDL